MKILVNGYIGKKITGIGRTLYETIRHIAKLDNHIEFIIYTNFDNYEYFNLDWGKNVTLKKMFVSRSKPIANLFYNTFVFPFLAMKEKVDLVYYPNFTFIPFKMTPVVCVIHDLIEFKIKNKFSPLRVFYRKIIVPRMAKIADKILTVSENSKKDIIEILKQSPGKIQVVYDAVSEEFDSIINNDRIIKEDYILYVGTVDHPGKNVYNAIKGFELLKEKDCLNLKFVICGMPGKGFEIVDNLINASKYKDDILYMGYVSDDKLKNIYHYAKLFIFISYYEGFGLPILEAMKHGIPVITSNRSSLPEVAGKAAIIVEPDDINKISEAISSILRNEELRNNLIKEGFKNLVRFSWDKTAIQTLKIFKNVIGG